MEDPADADTVRMAGASASGSNRAVARTARKEGGSKEAARERKAREGSSSCLLSSPLRR